MTLIHTEGISQGFIRKVEIEVKGKFVKLRTKNVSFNVYDYVAEEEFTAFELGELIKKLQEAKKQAERNKV